jgi:hypothetical protein
MTPAVLEPPTEEQPALAPLPARTEAEDEVRFGELAASVRRHRALTDHPAVPRRPADHALYRALSDLETDG